VQTAGGGDVGDVCQAPAGQGGGGAGGAPGIGDAGGAPSAGSGGGVLPVPPGGECNPNATKCSGDAQQTCDANGKWGEAQACDIACDAAGSACKVPVQVVAGSSHACARLSDGTVWCWGDDKNGELGNGASGGSAKPTPVPSLEGVVNLIISKENLSRETTCAILNDASVRCWGANEGGVVTAGGEAIQSPIDLGVSNVRQLAIGSDYSCVLDEQSAVLCRGGNRAGQLGNGGTQDSIGFGKTEPLPSPPKQLVAGLLHNCVLMEDSSVACWGSGNSRQTGGPNEDDVLNPTRVAGVSGIQQISLGESFSCALRADGAVQCWGSNQFGELGRGNAATGGQGPGFVKNFGGAAKVSARSRNSCAAKTDKTLWCWGVAESGQLGSECGDIPCLTDEVLGTLYLPTPTQVPLSNVVDVTVGGGFVCALTSESKVYCWGDNRYGELGINQVGGNVPRPTKVVWKLREGTRTGVGRPERRGGRRGPSPTRWSGTDGRSWPAWSWRSRLAALCRGRTYSPYPVLTR
jgi:alpha-tubulin suppressor-like RCC1 family protein